MGRYQASIASIHLRNRFCIVKADFQGIGQSANICCDHPALDFIAGWPKVQHRKQLGTDLAKTCKESGETTVKDCWLAVRCSARSKHGPLTDVLHASHRDHTLRLCAQCAAHLLAAWPLTVHLSSINERQASVDRGLEGQVRQISLSTVPWQATSKSNTS